MGAPEGGRLPAGNTDATTLRDRAIAASAVSFTVSDPLQRDNPLVWCNQSFTRLTGYPADEAIGRNCRFLQGEHTDREAVTRVRHALAEGRSVTEVLLNYRKDGTAFWNEVFISPVTDQSGAVVNFVGLQIDVTERVLLQNEIKVALADAEAVRAELRLLTEATTWMNESLDTESVATRLADLAVPTLGDYCCVDLLGEPSSGCARRVAAKHRNPRAARALFRLGELLDPKVGATDPISAVLSGDAPVLMTDMPDQPWILPGDAEVERIYGRLRPRSVVIVPLRARGRVLGALTLCTERPYGRAYTQRDLYVASDLAGRAALAIDNARMYARQHDAVETLQRSLLPEVNNIPGLTVATRYLVSTDDAEVGGDWYDLLPLPDGAVGLAIGDVVGHDLHAAAAMGQLRGVLRSYAWEALAPGAVLDRCDQLVQGLDMAAMATAIYARLNTPAADGSRLLHYANAGHPPPLLRLPDGETKLLDQHMSPLIGAVPESTRGGATAICPPGSALLLYTDGLTDVRGYDPSERTALLRRTMAEADKGDMEQLCGLVLQAMATPDLQDDIALLAIHLNE
jgi:PAS domain S-box-containing protein